MFKNTIDIKVTGRNIERFIKRLNRNHIEILNLRYIKYNQLIIRIKKEDLDNLEILKTIYDIEIIDINGIDKIVINIKNNIHLIICILLSLVTLFILTNTIFEIDVIHNNPNLRKIIIKELKQDGIEKYKRKKTYDEIQKIKKNILSKYKDKIEWLEIKNVGIKYIVRVEERIITKEENIYLKQNIIAKKDALLLNIDAKEGEIVKFKNQYVKKGEIVISGDIKLFDEIKNQIMAKGNIYGEVWYKAKIEYPYHYKEKKFTGKTKKVFTLKILNRYFEIFNFKKYRTKIKKEKVLLKHSFLPISLIYETQYETIEIDEKLTKKEALKKAKSRIINYINSKLKEKEHIITTKKLKVEENNSKILLELFVSVCEDITDTEQIIEEQ